MIGAAKAVMLGANTPAIVRTTVTTDFTSGTGPWGTGSGTLWSDETFTNWLTGTSTTSSGTGPDVPHDGPFAWCELTQQGNGQVSGFSAEFAYPSEISYWWHKAAAGGSSEEADVRLQASANLTTWTDLVASHPFTTTSYPFTQQVVDLSAFQNEPSVWLRFRVETHPTSSTYWRSDFCIDDVAVTADHSI